MTTRSHILEQAIHTIFESHELSLPRTRKGKRKVAVSELQIALAVILVDLAESDERFDTIEYNAIAEGIRRVFKSPQVEVKGLVQRAGQILADLRGVDKFARLLGEHLGEEERVAVGEVIERVVQADGVEAGFEIYLKRKYRRLLGLPEVLRREEKEGSE